MKKEYLEPEFDIVKITLSKDILLDPSDPRATEDAVESSGVNGDDIDPGNRL